MFCQNCGSEINDNVNFCYNCGEVNSQKATPKPNAPADKNDNIEYNREALRCYLSDVRNLELIKDELSRKIGYINEQVNRLCIRYEIPEPYEVKNDTATILLSIFFSPIFYIVKLGKSKKEKKIYEEKLTEQNLRIEKEKAEKERLTEISKVLTGEWFEVDSILKKAYSLNIIPSQFRNLYASYYLCEFISTSNESFSSALLQCNLDEIKRQLATIIEQNQQMLVNQAIMIAQNDHIIEQNKKKLQRLAQIETNTALSAKYSQIAAVNTEACAWIAAAHYLKD